MITSLTSARVIAWLQVAASAAALWLPDSSAWLFPYSGLDDSRHFSQWSLAALSPWRLRDLPFETFAARA